MQKLASEFRKILVVTKNEKLSLGPLKEMIINPDSGSIVGISFWLRGIRKKSMAADISKVIGMGGDFIMLEGINDIGPANEIVRIKEVLDRDIEIEGSKVFEDTGKYIGKVLDYSVDLKLMKLERIYIASAGLLKFLSKELMVSAKNIVKIEKGRITIKSGLEETRKRLNIDIKVKSGTKAA